MWLLAKATVAQWLEEGKSYELSLARETGIGFEGYELRSGVVIWPPFSREYTKERLSPLTGEALYSYRVRAREARYERDYEAIVELEQYHYAFLLSRSRRWRNRLLKKRKMRAPMLIPPIAHRKCAGVIAFHTIVSRKRGAKDTAAIAPTTAKNILIQPVRILVYGYIQFTIAKITHKSKTISIKEVIESN